MNIVFYSNVTSAEEAFSYVPQLKKHNVSFIRIDDREKPVSKTDTQILLVDALLKGKIAGAGLDVIAPEPVETDNILLDPRIKDKLILTPHIAGITRLTVRKIYNNIWENITRLTEDKPLKNRVN